MKVANIAAPVARKLGWVAKKVPMAMGTAILAGGMVFCGSAHAVTVLSQDFEGLTLTPGDPSYTDVIPGWTRDNSGMAAMSTNLAYDGGTAMNIAEWVAQQGPQLGRATTGALTGQNALVFDGDAWDDFNGDAFPLGFNSYWMTDVDLSGIDRNNTNIFFGYEFASYDSQRGLAQVSFDGGANWQTLLEIDSDVLGNSVLLGESVSYSAGIDFTPTSDTMTLRFGMIDADNDWWFGVDNVVVADTAALTLSLGIDRDTGAMTLDNFTGGPIDISAYSILSGFEAFVPANWNSIAENYDADSGGSVDPDNIWSELTDPAAHGDLSEADLDSGTGTTIANGTSINLGSAGTWIRTSTEDDLVFEFISNGVVERGVVQFSGNGGQPFPDGDFDFDNDVDADDWAIFRAGQHTNMEELSLAEAYQSGDLTADLANDHPDFVAFKAIFNAANGAGSFDAMLAGVPEPSAIVLSVGAGLALLGLFRTRYS